MCLCACYVFCSVLLHYCSDLFTVDSVLLLLLLNVFLPSISTSYACGCVCIFLGERVRKIESPREEEDGEGKLSLPPLAQHSLFQLKIVMAHRLDERERERESYEASYSQVNAHKLTAHAVNLQ